MSKKITAGVAGATRRKLEALAAARFNGGIGRATVHAIRVGLDNPNHANTMAEGQDARCSVEIDEDLVTDITAYQVAKGVAKRTDAAKQLIEIGLSAIET